MLESQLRQTAVQDDLKMTAEQKQEISKLTSQAYQQQQALEALRKVLTSDQQARLQQISLQQEGILALARPEVVKELNLSLEQRASIQQFSKVFFEQSSKLSARLRDRSVSIDNYNEEGRRIQTEMNDNILGALTEEQRAAWKAKLGPLLPADNSRPPANPAPTDAQARQAFDLLDSNKDGQLSADEWARSRNVRGAFERANIQVEFPLKVETFLNQYRQATTSSQRP